MLCTICIVDRLSFLNVGRILPYPYPPGVGLYIYYMYFCQEQYLTFTHHVFSSPPTRPGGGRNKGTPLEPWQEAAPPAPPVVGGFSNRPYPAGTCLLVHGQGAQQLAKL